MSMSAAECRRFAEKRGVIHDRVSFSKGFADFFRVPRPETETDSAVESGWALPEFDFGHDFFSDTLKILGFSAGLQL